MSQPFVSVIVGVYNKERYIAACLNSVLKQTYRNFELIVIDDASTDKSLDVIHGIQDDRIRLIVCEKNSGHPGIPRNMGIRQSSGEYIAFIDADDLWTPQKLEEQVRFLETHPEYSFVHTKCDVIDAEGNVLYQRHGGKYPESGDCFAELMRHCFICTSSVMIRRSVIERVGLFLEADEFITGEDYEYFARCARRDPIAILEKNLVQYRNIPETISRIIHNWQSIPRDYKRHRIFLRRKKLWAGKMSKFEMKRIAFDAANENSYYWRTQRHFRKVAWFAAQMIRLFPCKWSGWKNLFAAFLRRT